MAAIPQTSPGATVEEHIDEYRAAVESVLESGLYVLGENVRSFEQEFAAFAGLEDAAGVASGTDAIELALRALGVGAGDLVFTVSHTAVATVAAIVRAGATPYFVDVDAKRYTMDPERLRDALRLLGTGAKPSAVVAVHLYGSPADMPGILEVAAGAGLKVVEDCAQAHGATLHGQAVGSFGDAATFSFYPTKNLGALGDGGAVWSSHDGVVDRVRELREYGWHKRFVSNEVGSNSRLDEVQAAFLRVALRHLCDNNRRRVAIADAYDRALAGSSIELPLRPRDAEHVFHQYVIQSGTRDELQGRLTGVGVGTGVHYPVPVHLQPAYRGFDGGSLRETERLATRILSLPMFPTISDEQVGRVTASIRDALRGP